MEVCRLKNIFITGCGSGLGKSLFEMGKNLDVNVFPHFRIKDQPNGICGDISDDKFLNNLPNFLQQNNINVFINNAAVYKSEEFLQISDDEIKNIINVNLTSQILITKRVYQHFRNQGFGTIFNINSLSGKYPSPKETIYSASKSGLYSFSKCLQLESLGSKIEIIDILLGAMKTKMTVDRQNYDSFIETENVSKFIYELILNHQDIFTNEIVLRKKN